MEKTTSIVFVSGGVRSGKSRFAEQLACENALKSQANLHYIACGQPSDREMKERIARHQQDRLTSGFEWKTWEQPVEIGKLATCFTNQDIVLLDCLTTLVNNEFFLGMEKWSSMDARRQIKEEIVAGVKAISVHCKQLIIVSNEVLCDELLGDEFVLTYKRLLGEIHQEVIAIANEAYLVEAGFPLQMKGVG